MATIRGRYRTGGVVVFVSQLWIVQSLTPQRNATSFWVRPSSIRRRLRWSPKVSGSSGYGFGFAPWSVSFPNGKKATRPCRCGHLDNPVLACGRAPKCARGYQSRISGPLFDRIDLHVEVPALAPAEMSVPAPSEPRERVAARVAKAREVQAERFGRLAHPELRTNAEAEGELLDKIAEPDAAGRELLLRATERMHLTARGYHRVLRVARTIADLDGTAAITRAHIAEALSFRRLTPERR